MPFDRRARWCVACLAMAACAPAVRPPAPPAAPEPVHVEPLHPTTSPGLHVVVGEMCPRGAGGRPAVAPLIMRGVQWTDTASEVTDAVERGTVPRFAVYGLDGKRAGVFATLGLVDIAPQQSVATGTYVGGDPCSSAAAATGRGGQIPSRVQDRACVQATGGCGLAIGEVERPDDPPEVPAYKVGGACVAGDRLMVDIDGDGRPEAFPLTGVLNGIRGPASEWSAAVNGKATCTPRFQLYDVRLAPAPDPGKPVDQRAVVKLDVLGVVDLDGDGRRDLVLALRFPTVRSIVVYSASETPERLALVGEATSFPR